MGDEVDSQVRPRTEASNELYLEIHGARGSMPVGTAEYARYGGDTTCYSLHHDDGTLIAVIDAGTGLRHLYPRLARDGRTIPLLLTHYHWDHIQGLSMCAPMWRGDATLQIHGPFDPHAAVAGAITPPWFPVQITSTEVEFHRVEPTFVLGDVEITTFPLHHPQGGVGYRFDSDGHSVVVATDHEAGTGADSEVVEASQGADLLVHDAQYLPEEIEAKRGWGHSTWEQATKAAAEAGVGRLLFASHDPTRSDEAIDRTIARAVEHFPRTAAASPGQHLLSV